MYILIFKINFVSQNAVCNRNLRKLKRYLKAKRTRLFTSAATNQRRVSKGGVKRSSGPISRIPGWDRVAVKVGVVQVEKVNDQMVL